MRRARICFTAVAMTVLFMGPVASRLSFGGPDDFCSQTARLLFRACGASVTDDSFVKEAICVNISDSTERGECLEELAEERTEGNQLCEDQRDLRLDACVIRGEDRYDPDFDPALFDNPKTPTKPNPYFPLKVGNRWKYVGGDQVDTVTTPSSTISSRSSSRSASAPGIAWSRGTSRSSSRVSSRSSTTRAESASSSRWRTRGRSASS